MFAHKTEIIVISTLLLVFLVFIPQLLITLLAINLALLVISMSFQLRASTLPLKSLNFRTYSSFPFISIHIPIHNEPPEVVEKTLRAISSMGYQNYEAIVLDNNTRDKNVWIPVKELCKNLGSRFKFYHYGNVKGFKAGALNLLLGKTSKKAEYIAVVDADYEVQSNFLEEAVKYFDTKKVALVQFPQAYTNIGKRNLGMVREFQHFFLFYMNMANYHDSVTSTGTLSIYRKDAIEAIGGWNTRCITEDSELGLQLILAGYKTKYVNKIIGRGLMPIDLSSFRKQRDRWIVGNAQILKTYTRDIISSDLTLWQKISLFIQLTAWFNLLLIPAIALLGAAFVPFIYPVFELKIAAISAFTILAYIIFKLAVFVLGFRSKGYSPLDSLKAFFTHLGLMWEGATSWVACLLHNHEFSFARTNKFVGAKISRLDTFPSAAMGFVTIAAFVHYITIGEYLIALMISLLCTSFFAILYVRRQVVYTKEKTV
jgi:cellulose synthase/poly-beta-1,6-N-acetylglucosamine synthase-like glycosyltransferase